MISILTTFIPTVLNKKTDLDNVFVVNNTVYDCVEINTEDGCSFVDRGSVGTLIENCTIDCTVNGYTDDQAYILEYCSIGGHC
ncbi:hypothetical protein NDU88_006170 [Pleurodeles waltl]|uniref:Uncharacterized protein n=1 Tax=Pleurodeles waltl TaxID=8319 RepID=A0AAV7N7W8_PLEWA|nr:hypothetical protein NDU88_006170 [Pleurodeles waltl]